MKASKFSDAQKAFIFRQGDHGVPVAEICRKAGIRSSLVGSCEFAIEPKRKKERLDWQQLQVLLVVGA